MKLAPIIAQYLYSNKRLDLPGIGSFFLESPVVYEEAPGKKDKIVTPPGISFEKNSSIRESKELVEFIAAKTGKLKALAAADLESHLELIQQFLNIGKPFLLEGIGNLVKLKTGDIAFTSGQILPESLKDYSAREISSTSSTEETFTDYRKVLNLTDMKTNWRRPLVLLLIIAGIGLAIWGGYTVYKMNSTNNKPAVVKKETKAVPDPITPAVIHDDSIPVVPAQTNSNAGTAAKGQMKYILEKASAGRAFERMTKLKSYFWPVQLETKDSISYTLYMTLPSTFADTTRIIDSLTILNGKRVYIGE